MRKLSKAIAATATALALAGAGAGPALADGTTAEPGTAPADGTATATAQIDTGLFRVRTGNTIASYRTDGSVKVVQAADDTTYTGCQVYYPAGAKINLATAAEDADCWGLQSSGLKKTVNGQDRSFLGWSTRKVDDVANQSDENQAQITGQVTMPVGGITVYAVWAARPVLTYDVDLPDEYHGTPPTTPGSISADYGAQVADGSGWQPGDTNRIAGWKFTGWHTMQADQSPLYWGNGNPALTTNVTVYASWERLPVHIHYDPNKGQGSHADTDCWQYSDCTIPADLETNQDGTARFTRPGWKLTGWNTKSDGTGDAHEAKDVIHMTDQDVTLYAQWTRTIQMLPTTGGEGQPATPSLLLPGMLGLAGLTGGAWAIRRRVRTTPKHK